MTIVDNELVDIDADSNNDGVIDPDNSESGTDDPIETTSAAVVPWNDYGDPFGVVEPQYAEVNLNVIESSLIGSGSDFVLRLVTDDYAKIRVWQPAESPGQPMSELNLDPNADPSADPSVAQWSAEAGAYPSTLLVEALDPGWLELKLLLQNLQSGGGQIIEIARDVISLLVAPQPPNVSSVSFIEPEVIDNGYGEVDLNGNPNGEDDKPEFKGGDRFFPGAAASIVDGEIVVEPNGNNIVRVRATVRGDGVAEGGTVYFRAYDVDDPISDLFLDPNGDNGDELPADAPAGVRDAGSDDNRGRLSDIDVENDGGSAGIPADSEQSTSGGFQGHLRPIDTDGNPGKWHGQGDVVEAIIRKAADDTLFAEVDLATSFAPGDNFRVGASFDEDAITARKTLPTVGGRSATPQLSVWRKLHIEVDAMQAVAPDHTQSDRAMGEFIGIRNKGLGAADPNVWEVEAKVPILDAQSYQGGTLRMSGVNYDIATNSEQSTETFETLPIDILDVRRPTADGDSFDVLTKDAPLEVDAGERAPIAGDHIWLAPHFLHTANAIWAPYLIEAVELVMVDGVELTKFKIKNEFDQPDPTDWVPATIPLDGANVAVTSTFARLSGGVQLIDIRSDVEPEGAADEAIEIFQDDYRAEGNAIPTRWADPSKEAIVSAMKSFMQTSTKRSENRFTDAYIEPEYVDLTTLSSDIPAMPHLSEYDSVNDQTLIEHNASIQLESDVYWVAYVASAYEASSDQDSDADFRFTGLGGALRKGDGFRFGLTPGTRDFDAGVETLERSYTFVETIRDGYVFFDTLGRDKWAEGTEIPTATQLFARTTVHEMGHQFGLAVDVPNKHRDSVPNIMDADGLNLDTAPEDNFPNVPIKDDEFVFNPVDIDFMRMRRKSPGENPL